MSEVQLPAAFDPASLEAWAAQNGFGIEVAAYGSDLHVVLTRKDAGHSRDFVIYRIEEDGRWKYNDFAATRALQSAVDDLLNRKEPRP